MDIAIYVVCKAAYQQGILYGTWIKADQGSALLHDQIQAFLSKSPAPKSKGWCIDGYRGFYEIKVPQDAELEKVAAIADFIHDHDELGAKLLIKMEGDLEKAKHFMSECFMGKYQNQEDCVQDISCQINPDLENSAYEATVAWNIFEHGCFYVEVGDFLYVFNQYPDTLLIAKGSVQDNE